MTEALEVEASRASQIFHQQVLLLLPSYSHRSNPVRAALPPRCSALLLHLSRQLAVVGASSLVVEVEHTLVLPVWAGPCRQKK